MAAGNRLYLDALGIGEPAAFVAWLRTLTDYELDALLTAYEEMMQPRPMASPLTGARLLEWHARVEFSRPHRATAQVYH